MAVPGQVPQAPVILKAEESVICIEERLIQGHKEHTLSPQWK